MRQAACVLQLWWFYTSLQRALLAGSLESHKHFTTESQKKTAHDKTGAVSISRNIVINSKQVQEVFEELRNIVQSSSSGHRIRMIRSTRANVIVLCSSTRFPSART